MKTIAIIPVRLAATRFPNKPLKNLLGLPMVEHVRRRVALCPLLSETYVATCDQEIKRVVEAYGGKVIMTSEKHERCTDRIAEAAAQLKADIVVNVQGDEPLIHPRMIEEVVRPLIDDETLAASNLMIAGKENEFDDVNVVKVVVNCSLDLLYASRSPIPSRAKAPNSNYKKLKQLGIIAFRADFLQTFARLEPTPLEQIESVDMLRAIEHGYKVRMVETSGEMIGVDIPDQVAMVEKILSNDPLVREYMERANYE